MNGHLTRTVPLLCIHFSPSFGSFGGPAGRDQRDHGHCPVHHLGHQQHLTISVAVHFFPYLLRDDHSSPLIDTRMWARPIVSSGAPCMFPGSRRTIPSTELPAGAPSTGVSFMDLVHSRAMGPLTLGGGKGFGRKVPPPPAVNQAGQSAKLLHALGRVVQLGH